MAASNNERFEVNRNCVKSGTEALLRSAESLNRSERLAIETTEAGTCIVSELRTQTESLERARDNLDVINDQLNQSRNLMHKLYKRVLTNKFIVILIIILETAILGTIIYMKFIKK